MTLAKELMNLSHTGQFIAKIVRQEKIFSCCSSTVEVKVAVNVAIEL